MQSSMRTIAGTLKRGGILASKAIPLSGLVRLANTSPLIVYYHVVSDEDLPHIKHLYSYKSRKDFEMDIEFLLKTYRPVDLADLLDAVKSRTPLPVNSIFFTFDDGLREICDVVFPILHRKGIPAAFFVSSAFLDNKDLFYRFKASLIVEKFQGTKRASHESLLRQLFKKRGLRYVDFRSSVLNIGYQQRQLLDEIAKVLEIDFQDFLATHKPYMNSEQVERIGAGGFHLGGHSIDHPLFRSLAIEEQIYQTEESILFLKHKFHLRHNIFSFPFSGAGVSDEYFKRIRDKQLVDIFFGTGDFGTDMEKRLFQRMPYDGTEPHSIKRKYVQYITEKALGQLSTSRSSESDSIPAS